MTDKTARVLGLRAVAAAGWRWLPGMLVSGPNLLTRLGNCDADGDWAFAGTDYVGPIGGICWPDLRDPATLGCLVALVREAWGDPGAWVAPWDADGQWAGFVMLDDGPGRDGIVIEDTEAEAWVAMLEAHAEHALEAAP